MFTHDYFMVFNFNSEEIIKRIDEKFNAQIGTAIKLADISLAKKRLESNFDLSAISKCVAPNIHGCWTNFLNMHFEGVKFNDEYLSDFLKAFATFPNATTSPMQIYFVSKNQQESGVITFRHESTTDLHSAGVVVFIAQFGDFIVERRLYSRLAEPDNFYLNFNTVYGKRIYEFDEEQNKVVKADIYEIFGGMSAEFRNFIEQKDIQKCREIAKSHGPDFIKALISYHKDSDVQFLQEVIGYYKPIWDDENADKDEYEIYHKYDVVRDF